MPAANKSDIGAIDVIVALGPGAPTPPGLSRADAVTMLRERFEQDTIPLEDALRGLGGRVLDRAWINRTLKVEVPATAVAALEAVEGVRSVDRPRLIQAESA